MRVMSVRQIVSREKSLTGCLDSVSSCGSEAFQSVSNQAFPEISLGW